MKIYDLYGQELQQPDLNIGYLTYENRVLAEHPYQPEEPEEFHFEIMDGTNDLRVKIVDKPYKAAVEPYTEYEKVAIYHPYTSDELVEKSKPTLEQRLAAAESAILELAGMIGGTEK